MGWMETWAVDERMRLVLAVERQEEPMAALCRRFGVSRRIGYKWLERYRKEGVAGLADRSRAPRRSLLSHCSCLKLRVEVPMGSMEIEVVLNLSKSGACERFFDDPLRRFS